MSRYSHLSLKGIPSPEIMEKVDKIKRIFINDLKHPWRFILIRKWLLGYSKKFFNLFEPTDIIPNNVTDSAYEIGTMVFNFIGIIGGITITLARIVTFIIGYDIAYRLRIQDIINETTKEKLLENPRRELKRILKIYLRREVIIPDYMQWKFKRVFSILLLALYIPKFKRAFTKAIESANWEKIRFSKEDLDWCAVRNDYRFQDRMNCNICGLPFDTKDIHRECDGLAQQET